MHPPATGIGDAAVSKKRFSLDWNRFAPRFPPRLGQTTKPGLKHEREALLDEEVDPAAAVSQHSPPPRPPLGSDAKSKMSAEDSGEGPRPSETPAEDMARDRPPPIDPPQRRELETKILRQIIREFTSGAFFYSFDFDLTRTLQDKRRRLTTRKASSTALQTLLPSESADLPSQATFPNTSSEILAKAHATQSDTFVIEDDFVEPDVQVPLWRRADNRFFWNEYLLRDFIDAGLHSFALPIMQGWVQSSSFDIPISPSPTDPSRTPSAVPVDLVIVSRRSRDRAGLRFQRRGIDDDGHVANMVETEMIVRAKVSRLSHRAS